MKVRLGDVIFDGDARQLRRHDEEIPLSPKAFELLKALLENRPRALSKNELHERLWPSTYVSDGNLASLVAEVREALNDTARTPRFIRTAHRFGYSFCGEAAEIAEASSHPEIVCWLVREGQRVILGAGENVLGRDPDGVVQIDSVTVSRRHARITVAESAVVIDDLGSKNGTFVGGKPVSRPIALKDGDEIRVGSVVFRFRMPSPKGPTATWHESQP